MDLLGRGRRIVAVAGRPSFVAIAAITAVALFVRLYDLGEYPTGLHGDEGIAGMEAERVVDERGIGVYSTLAAGQPTGPLYLFAIPVELMGSSIVAVRVIPALLGALTVPLLYLVMRRNLGEVAGLCGAGTLAVMSWHIHYARIGFPLEAWPLCVVVASGALIEAIRSRDWRWWAAAGAAAAAGVYVYNAHYAFLGLFGAVGLGWLGLARGWAFRDRFLAAQAAFWAGVTALIPMGWYLAEDWDEYSQHFERDSMLERPEWTEESWAGRVEFVARGYGDWWERIARGGHPDFVDAIAVTPVVPSLLLLVAAVGIAVGLGRNWRNPLVQLGALTVALLPLASVLTDEAFARRTLAMAPFLAMFAGLFAGQAIGWARAQGRETLTGAVLVFGAVGAGMAWQDLYNYFEVARDDPHQSWVFADDLTQASLFMDALEDDAYVLFYSDRWTIDYETRLYLARNVQGEDRSTEFGRPGFDFNPGRGRPVFVFVGAYRGQLAAVERLYPGGEVTMGREGSAGPTFVAYEPR